MGRRTLWAFPVQALFHQKDRRQIQAVIDSLEAGGQRGSVAWTVEPSVLKQGLRPYHVFSGTRCSVLLLILRNPKAGQRKFSTSFLSHFDH